MAKKCQCLKSDGNRCNRMVSQKYTDQRFCWQHQNCKQMGKTWIQIQKFLDETNESEDNWKQLGNLVSHGIIDPPWLSVRKLLGPSVFVFYPNVSGRRVLLLGQSIDAIKSCQGGDFQLGVFEIDEWLGNFAVYGRQCLDIIITDDGETNNSFVSTIINTFELCDQKNQSEPNYANLLCLGGVRYSHIITHGNGFFDLKTETVKVKNELDQLNAKYISKLKQLCEYLLGINRKESIGKIFDQLTTDYLKIHGKIYDRKKIIEYLKIMWKWSDENSKIIQQPKFLHSLIMSVKDDSDMIWEVLRKISMNIYTISKLFVEFNFQQRQSGSISCRYSQYNKMKNVIICANDIEIYKKFIEVYFKTMPYIDNHSKKQCIEFGKPFDFFGNFDFSDT